MANKPLEKGGFLVDVCYYKEKGYVFMEMDIATTTTECVKVLAPIATTIVTYVHTKRTALKHAAKQSILQMIMEDQFNWELFRKFPVNYSNIMNEYEVYHKNGGNGEVTKKVNEYKDWYISNENEMNDMRTKVCKPQVQVVCSTK